MSAQFVSRRRARARFVSFRRQIDAAFDGQPVCTPLERWVAAAMLDQAAPALAALRSLLFALAEFESPMLRREPYIVAMGRLAHVFAEWKRNPKRWAPASEQARPQFSSLLRHLI